MKKCASCGRENEDFVSFCDCGSSEFVEQGVSASPAQMPPPVSPTVPGGLSMGDKNAIGDDVVGVRSNAGMDRAAEPGGLSMGDKNVIAGDVVGRQENIRITGTATIVKNEDETKKMVKCHVCGRNIAIIHSVTCPVCQEMTCENCFDTSLRACTKCIQQKNANKEEVYVNALRKALEDGRMTLAERQELNALQRQLGISMGRAFELEKLIKNGAMAAKNTSSLSSYVQISLKRALDFLYDEGDVQKAYDSLLPIYKRYPENEEVLTSFLYAAMQVDPEEAQGIIQQNQADVVGMHLVCIDCDLMNGDLNSADERLAVATRLWPDDLLVACRRILCLKAMYDELRDDMFLEQAADILASLPEPQNKLESSWVCRVRNAVYGAMGDEVQKITRDYCRENDLYFALSSGFGEEAGKDPEELYRQAAAVRESDPASYVELLSEIAEQGHVKAQYDLGECYYYGRYVTQDRGEAVKWYLKAGEQGHADAQYSLGFCYANGQGVGQDRGEAVNWYRKAAEQGHSNAQNSLGFCYQKGFGVTQDLGEAVKWYRKAAEQGNSSAQNNLGICYANGRGVTQDHGEAARWYRKSAEQGNQYGQYDLGDCYYYGRGVNQDRDEAAKWYRKAAAQGNPSAQHDLGFCYQNGYGVTQDHGEAVKWYRKAAEQGHANAQYSLGECYYYGRGVDQDRGEAVKWYFKAAEQGHASAQYSLGFCYANGQGVGQDRGEALNWYRKAAERGNKFAQNDLGDCYYYGRGGTQDYGEAAKWYRKAAEQGHASAQNSLGFCYKKGFGVTQDHGEAAKWYRKAAEQGNASAQNSLGICYEEGRGVTQDYGEAVKWYLKSAEQGNRYGQYDLGDCYEKGHGVNRDYAEALKWYRKAAAQGHENAKQAVARLEDASNSAPAPAPAPVRRDDGAAIEAMKNEVERMLLRVRDDKIFVLGDLNRKKLNNAIEAYASNLDPDDVVVQVDDTVWGSAKDGCLITESEIYVKDINGKQHYSFGAGSVWGLKKGIVSSSLTLDGDAVFEFTQAAKDAMEKLVAALNKLCELQRLALNS